MTDRPVLGVDPGLVGGLALLYEDYVHAIDIPVVDGEVDVDAIVLVLRNVRPRLAVIEAVHSMPKQGVSSSFKFGQAYGALRGAVAACGIPHRLVTPQKWKKHFGLGPDKEKARALAIQTWPGVGCFSRKRDKDRAEAALLALYGEQVFEGRANA
jgi:Holliday junction resolvasome RuvABC endonuclease subunit